jgi:hypothetical protein
MPTIRIAGLRIGLKPAAAVLAAGALALVSTGAIARLRRLLATTGGPVILLLANGRLLRGERLLFPPAANRRLGLSAIGTTPGDGPEEHASGRIALSPSGKTFALTSVDILADGVDAMIAIRSAATDSLLFFGTDNTLAPETLWSGDDPAAPAWLLAEQALRDADWQLWLSDDPTLPRPIVKGRFADVSTDGEASADGWTADGALRVRGRTRPSFSLGTESWPGVDLQPWWAIVGPSGNAGWAILASGHGEIPSSWPAVPAQVPILEISVDPAGSLRVDGVPQAHPMLDAAVIAADGPFS